MAEKRRRNRKHGIIDGLPADLKDAVEQMILTGAYYDDVVDFLKENGTSISASSVCRYARAFNESMETLNIAQENFNRMMSELEKYPDLDTTEAIIRITSQNLLNALTSTDEEDWKSISPDKMLKEANGLIRAAAYKKRVEVQNQDVTEAGLDAVKSLVFEAMAKEQPELYRQVSAFLAAKKQEGLDKGG